MIGTQLAQYHIDAELGRGGMGIVYRATDTKLNRTVALKILPAAVLGSEDDRARFFREAQAAAQLHHPNIATVFGIDEAAPHEQGGEPTPGTEKRPFIAMEFIAGETLQERIRKGPLKLTEAVSIAVQVAEALKAAHAKQIVHRDIKSANVMLTPDGVAKVLDFGLAKTQASTMLTRQGSTLGTVAYMSPEQARGQEVDGRSDLYSLGTMLYEMVAGRLPFGGDYEQAILYGILNEPAEPLTAVRTGVPMEVERLVAKLLTKEADYRYQTAADLIADLKSLDVTGSGHSRRSMSASVAGAPVPAVVKAEQPKWVWPGVTVISLVAGLVAGWFLFTTPPADVPLRQVEISFDGLRGVSFPALSPGNRYVAVQATDADGRYGIYVKDLETNRVRYVEGSDVAGWEMRYSPDGTKLAFMRIFNKGVYVLELPDGVPEKLTDFGRIAYWQNDETVVMTDDRPGGGPSYRVPIDGGELQEIRFDETGLEAGFGNVLKSGIPGTPRAFGLQTVRVNEAGNSNGIYRMFTAHLDTGELVILDSAAVNPEYVQGGYLVYNVRDDDGVLNVRPIDPESGLFVGQPKDAVAGGPIVPWGNFGVSGDGDLVTQKVISVIRVGGSATGVTREVSLWRVQADMQESARLETQLPSDQEASSLALKPDGSALVFVALTPGEIGGTVYSLDLQSGVQSQVTFGGLYHVSSISPDGDWVYATSGAVQDSRRVFKVVRIRLDGTGTEETVREGFVHPIVAPDGRSVLMSMVDEGTAEPSAVHIVSLDGDTETVLFSGPAFGAGFSPDGRYVLIVTIDSAESAAIMVYSVDGRERYTLPNVRGVDASWSPDGKHIYFVNLGTNLIRSLPVRLSPTFATLGPAEDLKRVDGFIWSHAFAADGTLYTASSRPGVQSADDQTKTLLWMQNWSAYLKRQFGR